MCIKVVEETHLNYGGSRDVISLNPMGECTQNSLETATELD